MKKIPNLKKCLPFFGTVAPFAALAVLACGGDSKTALNMAIDAADFELTGTAGSGSIKLKSTKELAEQLEVRYFIGTTTPTDDATYSSTVPTNLKNGDVIYAKLFLKSNFTSTHTFTTTAYVRLSISKLAKMTLTSNITSTDFEITGPSGNATIGLKSSVNSLDTNLEIGYFVGATAPTTDVPFIKSPPTNLANGNKVWIKILAKDVVNYVINFDPISVDVSGLKTLLTDTITPSDFTIGGTTAGSGSLTFSKAIASQLEVQYARGATEPAARDFSAAVPSNLFNNDKVWMKLVVKTANTSTHEIAANLISKDIIGLAKVTLTDTVAASNFEFVVDANSWTLSPKSTAPSLNANAEIRYYKGQTEPTDNALYNISLVTGLASGDKVWVKIFPKDAANYQTTFSAFSIDATGLGVLLSDRVAASDFAVSGAGAGSGTLTLNKIIAQQLEVQYATGDLRPASNNFSTAVPSNLENGNKVWIKLVVKAANSAVYNIGENMIVKEITGLSKTTLTEVLVSTDILAVGVDSQGVATLDKTISDKLEPRYFKGTTAPSDDSSYKPSLNLLSNGEKIWVKLFVKPAFSNNYQITFSPVSKDITLLIKTLADTLEIFHIEASGTNNSGILNIRSEFLPSSKLEVRYAKSATEPTSDTDYNANISNLANGDRVYAKLFVKSGNTDYTISATAKSFRVYFDLVVDQFKDINPGHIILSNNITTIPKGFVEARNSETSLETSFVLPSGVTTINDFAFRSTIFLNSLHFFRFNNVLTTIGIEAFAYFGSPGNIALPRNFVLPDTVVHNDQRETLSGMFCGRIINSEFVIPPLMTSILMTDFAITSLPIGFKIPLTVTHIGAYAFTEANIAGNASWYNKDHIKIAGPEVGAYVGLS